MTEKKYLFGKNSKGEDVYKYVIGNENGMQVTFTDLGAAVTSIQVLDQEQLFIRNWIIIRQCNFT